MKQEIDPKDTNRKEAFEHWMKSPMPMVTLTKTFDVTRLYKMSKRKGFKFNMLLCWCIAKTASKMEEFYLLPGNGKLYKYTLPSDKSPLKIEEVLYDFEPKIKAFNEPINILVGNKNLNINFLLICKNGENEVDFNYNINQLFSHIRNYVIDYRYIKIKNKPIIGIDDEIIKEIDN